MAYIGSSPTKVVSRQSANIFTYTATANQTAFTGADDNGNTLACSPSDIMVHMNGIKLEESDYTASTTTVTLVSGAAAGDEVTITAFLTFESADHYTKSAADTRYVNASGDTMSGALIGTSASFVGDVNIGNNDASNPANKLRFGATQYGAADIAPLDEGGHKVGMAFYTDGTGDTTIDPVLRMQISNDGRVGIGTSPEEQMRLTVDSQSNFGSVYVGQVIDSANNNSEALLMHRLDGNQTGFQFSGEIYCNSWTGQAHVNFNATAYYINDNVTWNINHSGIGGGVSKAQLKLATVSYDSKSWLAIIKDGGGTGIFYINAFLGGNISSNGGLRAIASSSYSVTTTHVNLN